MNNYQYTLKEIEHLREKGYKVRVAHLRKVPSINLSHTLYSLLLRDNPKLQPILDGVVEGKLHNTRQLRALGYAPEHCGGLTRVEIVHEDGDTWVGEAPCSKNDRFNKKIGLSIAFGRAFSAMLSEQIANEIVQKTPVH